VAANVKRSSRTLRRFDIYVRVQDAFLALERTGSNCPPALAEEVRRRIIPTGSAKKRHSSGVA
jgi:hypothetical protein